MGKNVMGSGARHLDEKFTDLESKYSFQENMLSELNEALISQQNQLDAMKLEIALIKQHLAEAAEFGSKPEQYTPAQEKPPHY